MPPSSVGKCATEELSGTCPKLELRSGDDADVDDDDDDEEDDDDNDVDDDDDDEYLHYHIFIYSMFFIKDMMLVGNVNVVITH